MKFKIFLFLILLFSSIGVGSATNYYVSTTGNNINDGLTIENAWATPSYAVDNIAPNDTIWALDGTWYNEHVTFSVNYTNLKAYNGTPTLDGLDFSNTGGIGIKMTPAQHSNVSGITILNYEFGIQMYGNYNVVDNVTITNTEEQAILMCGGGCRNNTIQNSEMYNGKWNIIQVTGNREPPNGGGVPSYNMTIKNNIIHQSNVHSSIDLFGNIQDMLIEENTFYNSTDGDIYHHSTGDWIDGIIIRNNVWEGGNGTTLFNKDCISLADASQDDNILIHGNIFRNFTVDAIYVRDALNLTISDNEFYNVSKTIEVRSNDSLLLNNYIETDSGKYTVSGNKDIIIRNPRQYISFYGWDEGGATFKFTDGKVYTTSYSGTAQLTVPVRYYPTHSNSTRKAANSANTYSTATVYDMWLTPLYGYLKSVVVNEYNLTTEIYNLTINSSVVENPTWMNVTVANASNTYNISRDGTHYDTTVSNTDSMIKYYYNVVGNEWSEHTFEVTWVNTSGWTPTVNHIYKGYEFETDDSGNITQKCNVPQEAVDITNIFKMVII